MPNNLLNDNLLIMNKSSNTSKILQDLLAFPSITPEDHGCQDYIINLLNKLGFQSKKIIKNGILNHWCVNKQCNNQTLLYLCHTDVVPANDNEWVHSPFKGIIKNGKIYGRGACDMKGSIAAMLSALIELTNEGIQPNMAWIITGDEEGDAKFGSKHVIETEINHIKMVESALVGEPTSEIQLGDVMKNGRRGSLNLDMQIQGLEGHAAYQENASNPISTLIKILNELSTFDWGTIHPYFPKTSFCVSQIVSGNDTFNQTPQTAQVKINWRFNPTISSTEIKSIVVNTINRYCDNYLLNWYDSATSFFTKPGKLSKLVSEATCTVCGLTPDLKTNGGTSDARFLHNIVPEIIEFGLINKTAHQPNEHVKCSDLEDLKKIYKIILKHYSVK